jgi:hypothetical protein
MVTVNPWLVTTNVSVVKSSMRTNNKVHMLALYGIPFAGSY